VSSILERHRERFLADPGNRRAFEALEESHFVSGEWDALVSLYEHRLSAPDLAGAPRERARLLFRLGQIWGDRRGDLDHAAECYRRALQGDPTCHPALAELRRIHASRGQWDVALQIAEAEATQEMSSGERAALLAEVGEIWRVQLMDPEQALAHFEKALDYEPEHAQALEGAARAAHALDRPRRAAELWERLVEQQQAPSRAASLVAWAGLLTGALGETERAAELYRRALDDDPRNRDALQALAAIAEASNQYTLLVDLHERRFELTADAEQRAEIALAAAHLCLRQLDDAEAARRWLGRAVDLDTGDPRVYRALAEVERERGDEAALRRALEQQVACSGERPSISCLLELASLQSDAGEDELALASLQRALDLTPEDALVVEALSETLARLERHEDLVDCLERRAALAATDPTTCASVLGELGTVHEQRLGDLESARSAYERAMHADPTSPSVAASLERIYRKTEAWDSLRESFEQLGRSGPREQRPTNLCKLGALLLERFEDREGAARAFEAALALDRTCGAAHRGRQKLATEEGDEDAILEAYENEVAVATERSRIAFLVRELTRILEGRDRPKKALEWAERWIAAAPEDAEALRIGARLHEQLGHDTELMALLDRLDPLLQSGEQAANRRRMAGLHAARGRGEEAIAAYRAALEADPADVEAFEGLVEQLEPAGRPEELAQARQRLAELLPPPRRAACLDELARLLEERLGDLPGAIDALVRLVDSEGAPGDVEERLETLLERTARYEELAERLAHRARAHAFETPEAQALALRHARVLLEHLSRFEEAAAVCRAILAVDPGCDAAREGLERGLRAAGDTAGLADFLAEQMASHPDPATRDGFAFERAVILEEALERALEAAEIYRQLAERAADPDDRSRASGRLERLLERTGEWQALREHWENVLEGCADEEKERLHERLGRLCRDRLRDTEAAIEHLEAAAELASGRPELWHALALLYEESGQPGELARVLEAELASGAEGERELAIRSRVAELWANEIGDPERAQPHYERILEIDPGESAAGEFLIRLFEAQDRRDQVARVLELRLSALDALPRDEAGEWAAQRTSLRLRIAGLRAGELDDPDGAIAVLEPALGEIGPQAVVAEPLADLYQRTGYIEDLIDLCRRAAAACEAGTERASWLTRLADALRGRGELREATEAYRQVLDERPDDAEAEAALRELYRQLGEAEPLAHLLEAELTRLAGPEEIPVRMELAKLLTGELGRPADALVHLRRVVQVDPSHAEALDRGLELAEHLEQREVLREILDGALSRPQPPSARAALLTRRGRVLSSDPERAFEAAADYREALSLGPARNDIRQALRSLLESTGQWEGVLDCLFLEASSAESERRATLFEQAADIAWEHLSPEAALPWLERLRCERPREAAVVARIAELHRIAERPGTRLRALEQQTALTPDTLGQRDLHVEQARVLERELGAPVRAVAALEQARRLCPRDSEVLHQLERLYRSLGRDHQRAEVLEALAEATHKRDRVSLLCEAATLHSGPLANPQRAAALLRRAVTETPKSSALHAELLHALGDALRAAGELFAWVRCAETELSALDPNAPVFDERRRELHRQLAAEYQKSGRLDAALRHLRRLLHDAPEGFDASGELEQALLQGLRAQGNWVELERRLTSHLERRPGDAEGWLELARLREEQLCATAGAAEAYSHVLETDAGCLTALRGLRSASERLGEWEKVARTLEWELEHPETRRPEARSALLRRLGDLCWERLGSTTRASRSYAAALEANPDDFAAHSSLQRLLEAMEDWRGALDLYESELEVLGERKPERRQQLWLRAGEIARDHTGEIERALRAYVNASKLGPLPVERRAELADLHRVCGEVEAFAEVFASWCDDPDAPSRSLDYVRLAETLAELGREADALARTERALELDPECGPAWDVAARLHESRGDSEAAVRALERAAELATDGRAAERLVQAAQLREPDDLEAAAELLRRASACDPASAPVQAARATVAAKREAHQEAEDAAARALELCGEQAPLEAAQRLAAALVGGQAARALGRIEAATRFFATALEIEPQHPKALAGAGETLAALGDLEAARPALEARLALDEPDPERALHHALLARCLEAADAPVSALEHCEAALAEDPEQDEAHELCVALHETAARVNQGIAALERWADAAAEPADRAARLLRAAAWELREGGRQGAAERHLRDALESDPLAPQGWQELASLLWERERAEEALEVASQGLEQVSEPAARATLALVRARALELRGEPGQAAEAFAIAAEADPRCVEAATSRARLLRSVGKWQEAADALEAFTRRHPGDNPGDLAEALQQLGRLQAGPLEDVEAAIAVYRRGVELEPERLEIRATLAQILSQRPGDWREALTHHCSLLESNPLNTGSLRAVLRIAQERKEPEAATDGLLLLRALGIATADECERAPERLSVKIASEGRLDEPLWERLREAVQKVSREIGSALGAPESPSLPNSGDAAADFRAASLDAEARLAAPGLLPLPTQELADVLTCVATLALEPDQVHASGATLNALAEALGRRARRRVKRILGDVSLDAVQAIDFAAWRSELRALAAATAVDETGCDPRTALLALVCEASNRSASEITPTTDLTPLVADCPEARALLRWTIRAWIAGI
jgi:tetratricopeptide (TPR) repeat protein